MQRLIGKRAGDAVEEIVHEALVALGTDLSRPRTT
jgi:hypothetical protein